MIGGQQGTYGEHLREVIASQATKAELEFARDVITEQLASEGFAPTLIGDDVLRVCLKAIRDSLGLKRCVG